MPKDRQRLLFYPWSGPYLGVKQRIQPAYVDKQGVSWYYCGVTGDLFPETEIATKEVRGPRGKDL